MDASQIISNMNERWTEMLGLYYDHVSESFLKHMAEEFDLNLDELIEKSKEVKEEIVNMATTSMSNLQDAGIKKKKPSMAAMKAAKKAHDDSLREKNKYSDSTRDELISQCKEYKLPVRRKNQDMIEALLAHEAEDE